MLMMRPLRLRKSASLARPLPVAQAVRDPAPERVASKPLDNVGYVRSPIQRVDQSMPSAVSPLAQRKAQKSAHTGLPESLKAGIESLSGLNFDQVKVHYNSSKPAQLRALAYAKGQDIHLAPGQEHHLPHEAWHLVQQAQGRVKATRQLDQGVAVNDDAVLEAEADRMGGKACNVRQPVTSAVGLPLSTGAPAQRFPAAKQLNKSDIKKEWVTEVEKVDSNIKTPELLLQALLDAVNFQQLRDWKWPPNVVTEIKTALHDKGESFFDERQKLFDKKPEEMIKLRRRNSNDFSSFGPNEIQDFRKDKIKNSIPIKFLHKDGSDKKMTLQGNGYFAKGGKAYDEEIDELMKKATGKDDNEKIENLNQMLLQGLQDPNQSAMNIEQESILAIVNLAESARSSNNILDLNYALENNPKLDTKDIFINHTLFGPAKKKSPKELAKLTPSELTVHNRWSSTLGGSQGSQFHKLSSLEKRLKKDPNKYPHRDKLKKLNIDRHEVLKRRYREKSPELEPEVFEQHYDQKLMSNSKDFVLKRKRDTKLDSKKSKKIKK